jgi:hypothetical protein
MSFELVGPSGVPERLYAAQHEAGHAVIARVLCGFSAGGAELAIVPGNVVGQAGIPCSACIKRRLVGKRFSLNGAISAEVAILCAGTEAEKQRYFYCTDDDEIDRAKIGRLLRFLPEREGDEAFLRRVAFSFVEHHQATIHHVADALAEKFELTGAEIDAMMPAAWIARAHEPCSGPPYPCDKCAGTYPLPFRPSRSLAGKFYSSALNKS